MDFHEKHSFSTFNFQFSIVMRKDERYNQRGVSASKEDVHNAIKNIDKGIFPKAFCKIIPDYLGGQKSYCNIMHADGAGTKSSLAYMYWKETGDLSVWKGIAQDALIMNIDDLLCVGAVDNILLSSTIGRNKKLIPGTVVVFRGYGRPTPGVFMYHDTNTALENIQVHYA